MLRRTSLIVFLLAFLLALPQTDLHAQFWKKKEKKRTFPPRSKPVAKPPATAPVKKMTLDYPTSRIRTRYRIDVLVPLYLEEIVKGDTAVVKDHIPDKAYPGINFYEGVKLATDTLSALGYNIDVYVHDVTQESLSPENLVKFKTLKGTDLIIGALPSAHLPVIAEFAKKNAVNFISAASPSDAGIKENLFFTMIQPGLGSHCRAIKQVINRKHTGRNVLVFYRDNNTGDSLAAGYFRKEQNYSPVLWNSVPAKPFVEAYLDSTVTNLIVVPVLDNGYADSMLQFLSREFPAYDFEVFGMPTWKFMNSLKKTDAIPNVAVNFTTPFYFEPASAGVQNLVAKYRKEYGNRPAEMVFIGYETFYWHAYLLQKYGSVFNNRQSDLGGTAFTRLEIKPQWTKDRDFLYNENEHVYLYRYKAGSYMVE